MGQNTLIEVNGELLIRAAEHLTKCQKIGELAIERLKEKKVKVRHWLFFKKEVSLWSHFLRTGTNSWSPTGYLAHRFGLVTEEEGQCIDLVRCNYDFRSYTKHGRGFYLDASEYMLIDRILSIKV